MWRLDYDWRDNNGKDAACRVFAVAALSFPDVLALGELLAVAMENISNARLVSFTISRRTDYTIGGPAALTADVRQDAVLLYRNGNSASSFLLPSPDPLLFETAGPYAGLRVTRSSLELLGVLADVDSMLQSFIDPVGRPYPSSFTVGGRTRL